MDQQIKETISNEIKGNDVCLFMKGSPDAPQCGFSLAVANILKVLEVNFKSVDVLQNQDIRQGIKDYSDWPTIPQLYIKNEFIGGCDIIKEMFENGELKKVLNSIDSWAANELESNFKSFTDQKGIGIGKVMQPMRFLICGSLEGPSLFDLMELIGKKESLNRINYVINKFKQNG